MSKYFLLIDDDEDDRHLFSLAASEVGGISSVTAQNQKEVKEVLKDGKDLPDLIFLDLNMPVFSGWDFLDEFKNDARLKNVPVIIYSTSSSQRDIERSRSLKALCFMVKPDDFQELKRFLSVLSSM